MDKLKKILVIDDEAHTRKALQDMLKQEKMNVLTANDGEAGLEIAQKEQPDLIMLDIMLPNTDGIDVLKTVRSESWGKGMKVIMFTNISDIDQVQECMHLGADGYLIKSNVDISQIKEKIDQTLNLTSG